MTENDYTYGIHPKPPGHDPTNCQRVCLHGREYPGCARAFRNLDKTLSEFWETWNLMLAGVLWKNPGYWDTCTFVVQESETTFPFKWMGQWSQTLGSHCIHLDQVSERCRLAVQVQLQPGDVTKTDRGSRDASHRIQSLGKERVKYTWQLRWRKCGNAELFKSVDKSGKYYRAMLLRIYSL